VPSNSARMLARSTGHMNQVLAGEIGTDCNIGQLVWNCGAHVLWAVCFRQSESNAASVHQALRRSSMCICLRCLQGKLVKIVLPPAFGGAIEPRQRLTSPRPDRVRLNFKPGMYGWLQSPVWKRQVRSVSYGSCLCGYTGSICICGVFAFRGNECDSHLSVRAASRQFARQAPGHCAYRCPAKI
jgi:hypothetical protein